MFESMKVPFTVVEGYIGEVSITVPWQYILVKSVDLEVKQLQLTLQLQHCADDPPGDIGKKSNLRFFLFLVKFMVFFYFAKLYDYLHVFSGFYVWKCYGIISNIYGTSAELS